MEITGFIKEIFKEEAFGNNDFKKREFVITTEEQYPQPIIMEFTQEKCSILDNLVAGDRVKVSTNLKGREWTNPQGEKKYFLSLQAWKIEKISSQTIQAS